MSERIKMDGNDGSDGSQAQQFSGSNRTIKQHTKIKKEENASAKSSLNDGAFKSSARSMLCNQSSASYHNLWISTWQIKI